MEDKCKGCIRIDPEMQFKIEICPKCNQKTYEGYLDGRCYVRNCTNCGDGYVAASFYGNCEMSSDTCEYLLDVSNVDKEGLIEFSNRYNIKVVTLLKLARMKKLIRLKCDLSEVLEEEAFLKSIEVGFVMSPPMPYSYFYTCKGAIRPKRFCRSVEIGIE